MAGERNQSTNLRVRPEQQQAQAARGTCAEQAENRGMQCVQGGTCVQQNMLQCGMACTVQAAQKYSGSMWQEEGVQCVYVVVCGV